jgi:hypothetical protein
MILFGQFWRNEGQSDTYFTFLIYEVCFWGDFHIVRMLYHKIHFTQTFV